MIVDAARKYSSTSDFAFYWTGWETFAVEGDYEGDNKLGQGVDRVCQARLTVLKTRAALYSRLIFAPNCPTDMQTNAANGS